MRPEVAELLRERGVEAHPLRDWRNGHLLSAPVETILAVARDDGLTLVTYDLATVPAVLRSMAEAVRDHAGVVFAASRTIARLSLVDLADALASIADAYPDMRNHVLFLG